MTPCVKAALEVLDRLQFDLQRDTADRFAVQLGRLVTTIQGAGSTAASAEELQDLAELVIAAENMAFGFRDRAAEKKPRKSRKS